MLALILARRRGVQQLGSWGGSVTLWEKPLDPGLHISHCCMMSYSPTRLDIQATWLLLQADIAAGRAQELDSDDSSALVVQAGPVFA